MKDRWLSWHTWLLSAISAGVAILAVLHLTDVVDGVPARLGVQNAGVSLAIRVGIYVLASLLAVVVSSIPFLVLSFAAHRQRLRKLSLLEDITDAMIDLSSTVWREFGREETYDVEAKRRLQESADRAINAIRHSYAGLKDSETDVFQARVSTLLASVEEHGRSEVLFPINRSADSDKARKAAIIEAGWGVACVVRLLWQLFGTVAVNGGLAVRAETASGR